MASKNKPRNKMIKRKSKFKTNEIVPVKKPLLTKKISTPKTAVSVLPRNGLTPKERAFIINSFRTKLSQYINLKHIAHNAIKNRKVFTIYGISNPVHKALIERGWVEKFPPSKMSLKTVNKTVSKTKINTELERLLVSNMLERHDSNFVWFSADEARQHIIDMFSDVSHTIINKLRMDAVWTSKQGLCTSTKDNNWFYIEEISEINTPRTYNGSDEDEIKDFIDDYRLTACTCLLKWVLMMCKQNMIVFDSDGVISLNVLVFALNRCKEYLISKINQDIDKSNPVINQTQWNLFIKKASQVLNGGGIFKMDLSEDPKPYLAYSKFLLKQIQRFRPQLCCEGLKNVWILKPTNLCRGRGIRMAAEYDLVCNFIKKTNTKYVIQKYIEDPLLIYETKFDIRQYYVVTSTCPLRIWMYKDCYLKFSSQKYDLNNYHESIHLTNNAVQRKYKNSANRHPELPGHNMWHSDQYKDYLSQIGKLYVWDEIVYPSMKRSIIATMLSCQDYLYPTKNRFELYGCDFVLDKEYKPWLIEVNSRPDLKSTTPTTSVICPAVLSDLIKVVVDRASYRKAPVGRFECIYKQPITPPYVPQCIDLTIRGHSLPLDYFYRGVAQVPSFSDPFFGLPIDCDSDDIMDSIHSFETSTSEAEDIEEVQAIVTSCSSITSHS